MIAEFINLKSILHTKLAVIQRFRDQF